MSKQAPHCWGVAASFTPTCKECRNCPYNISCAKQVLNKLALINERLNVMDLMKRTQAFLDKKGVKRELVIESKGVEQRFAQPLRVRFEVPTNISSLPRGAKMIAEAICKAGIDMRKDANQKTNSFNSRFRPSFMIGVQELVNQGCFTHDDIKAVIAGDRDVKPSTLKVRASSVATALSALGVVIKYGNEYETLIE